MAIHRFLVKHIKDKTIITGREAYHILSVLRLKPGKTIEIFDGKGKDFLAEITSVKNNTVQVKLIKEIPARDIKVEIACASAIPKGRKLTFMIQKLCELGLGTFIPVRFCRSVAKITATKIERLSRISMETAKQCRRSYLCKIENEIEFNQLPQILKNYNAGYLLDPYAKQSLIDLLNKEYKKIIYVVGPEGGLTFREFEGLTKSGLIPVRISSTILRIETAAISVMSIFACFFTVSDA